MNEENYEEIRFATDDGTIVILGVRESDEVWIGMLPGHDCEGSLVVKMKVSPSLRRRIAAALLDISNDDDE